MPSISSSISDIMSFAKFLTLILCASPDFLSRAHSPVPHSCGNLILSLTSADVDLFLWCSVAPPSPDETLQRTHAHRRTPTNETGRGWWKWESHLLWKLTSIRAVLPPSYISTPSIGPTLMLIHHPLFSLTCSFTVPVLFITHLPPSALYFNFSSFSLYSQWLLSICHHRFNSSVNVIFCFMQFFVSSPETKISTFVF